MSGARDLGATPVHSTMKCDVMPARVDSPSVFEETAGAPDVDLAVIVEKVSKSFGETRALDGCSFHARSGEIHAIVGENGSGKSTLAKILSGVIAAESGLVKVFGKTPRSPVEAGKLGVATIFQEILVANDASVADNLFVGSDGYFGSAMTRTERRTIARDLLKRLTLADIDPDAPVSNLPLSVKQWIVIGRALLTKPKLLILDESSAALDLDATNRLHQEIRSLRDAGCAVIIVTHRIAELIRITDRATVLRDGQVAGVLAKGDINEHNLLTLMTPPYRLQQKSTNQIAATGKQTTKRPVLTASGLFVRMAATLLAPNGVLTLVHASMLIKSDPEPGSLPDVYTAGARDKLEELCTNIHRETQRQIRSVVVSGDIVHALLSFVERERCDLLALGGHEQGLLDRFLFGSVRTKVIRHARCPVLVAPYPVAGA